MAVMLSWLMVVLLFALDTSVVGQVTNGSGTTFQNDPNQMLREQSSEKYLFPSLFFVCMHAVPDMSHG